MKTKLIFLLSEIIIIIFLYPQEVKISEGGGGGKSKIKNKPEWLRVGVVLNWESLVKEDWIEPLNQDTDPLFKTLLLLYAVVNAL